jgi:putative transposase
MTDAEWIVLEPLLPLPHPYGRRRAWPMREIINAIFYVLRTGCPWRMLPDCFPPTSTVYRWFTRLRDDGSRESINHHLVMVDRERSGRQAGPSAAVLDSQSVKTTEAGGPRGYDASVQDRDGAGSVLRASRSRWPFIALAFADAGYTGERVAQPSRIAVQIVRKQDGQVGFAVHPRRWVVERFFAWIGRNRRLVRDFEATITSAEAFLYAASAMVLLCRLGRC